MSNTADSSPGIKASLDEDSDVIELTEEVPPGESPDVDDDLDLMIPKFRVPTGQHSPIEKTDVSEDSVMHDSEVEEFDREELVRTVRMEAFDRNQIELLDSVRKWDVSEFLSDQRYAPDILIAPPRVLTKKWAEGAPSLNEANPGSTLPDDRSSLAQTIKSSTITDSEVEEVVAANAVTTVTTTADDSSEELEPLELDSEVIEHVSAAPPPKPAPKSTPPQQPPQRQQQAGRQRRNTKPIPRAAHPTPAPTPARDEDDMSGIVQELLEEKKPVRQQTAAELKRQNWFVELFNDEYLRTLSKDLRKQTDKEVNFIVESLGVKKGARIFDLACGFGRHSIELAERNFEVAGLDLSMPLLQRALTEAQRRALSIKFIHGDMRELNFNEIFDACYCWQSSFGYFDDKTNFKVLQGVHHALKPGGRFLLDLVNRDYVVAEMPSRTWWEGIECVFLEEVEFDYNQSIMHTKRSFIYEDGSPPQEYSSYIRLYGLHELRQILRIAGFEVLEISGEIHHPGSYLGAASSRLIILAEKR